MVQTIAPDLSATAQQEHDAVQGKLRRIRSALAVREINSQELCELLHEFQHALTLHFSAKEQSDGFFEVVTAHAPQLSHDAERLCVEHQELLHQADELCRFAAAGSPSLAWWRELRCRCHEFSTQLMRHEMGEHELLQRAFQDDIGTKD